MLMLPLQSRVLFVIFFSSVVSINRAFKYCKKIDSAKFDTDEGEVNLWPLALSSGQPRFKDIPDTKLTSQFYSFNPGNSWSDTRRDKGDLNTCQNIAVCMRYGNPTQPSSNVYANIGTQASVEYRHDAPSGSCIMSFKGQYLTTTTKSLITVVCDRDKEGKLDHFVSNEESEAWTYTSTLHTKYACVSSALSIGSILCITFASILVVYLIVGILVLKFVKGKSGKDVLPNVGFWSDFPFLVKDGIAFSFKTCRNTISGSQDGYTPI